MEVFIFDINENIVAVKTAIGCFNAKWDTAESKTLGKHIVEIDSEDVLGKSKIRYSICSVSQIKNKGDAVHITGKVEEIEDNIMYLRLQSDILMLELSDNFSFSQYVGEYVDIELSSIVLYDIG